MTKVTAGFTMSLDGFIAEPDGDVRKIFGWFFSGDIEMKNADGMVFKITPESAPVFEEVVNDVGMIVTGRGDFDASNAWGGVPPVGDHIFILTHRPPPEWADSPVFTFVTDGILSAIEQAKKRMSEKGHTEKNLAVSGSKVVQQALQAGIIDELHISLVPILLGKGIPLFGYLGIDPIQLEITRVINAPDVTHLRYRVIK